MELTGIILFIEFIDSTLLIYWLIYINYMANYINNQYYLYKTPF